VAFDFAAGMSFAIGYVEAMLTLSLLRHAKSSWDDPGIDDYDRPLASRGEAAAPRMGAFMAERGITPELILCSPATRARQTVELILPLLPGDPTVEYEEGFYLAASSALLARVRKIDANARHVLVIGHDPGLHGLAIDLAGTGNPADLQALGRKFPTAALAVITFDVNEWPAVRPGSGHLALFMTPKRLD
jgi:phosphohistidine phosphatase